MPSSHTWIALSIAVCITPAAFALDDWDLYVLKLVNRARQDPAGEAARIGSDLIDTTPPRPPLAYMTTVGNAATNHTNWMHANLGHINSPDGPDSFTFYETMDGLPTGTPATGTPGFTGVNVGARITAAGFTWDQSQENLSALVSTEPIPIDQALLDENHWVWWESDADRAIMLSADYTVFGHHVESRSFTPPLGGLDPPYSNINYATMDFARPGGVVKTYMLGVLYRDLDGDGAWTPRNVGDPQREGLGSVVYAVYRAGTTTLLTIGTTLGNGAFSINRPDGTYDIQFNNVPGTPTGKLRIENVTVAGQNVDVGDHNVRAVAAADFNGDGHVDGDDLAVFRACSTRMGVPYSTSALPAGCPPPVTGSSHVAPDFDRDGDVDLQDLAVFQRCYSGAAAPAANCTD